MNPDENEIITMDERLRENLLRVFTPIVYHSRRHYFEHYEAYNHPLIIGEALERLIELTSNCSSSWITHRVIAENCLQAIMRPEPHVTIVSFYKDIGRLILTECGCPEIFAEFENFERVKHHINEIINEIRYDLIFIYEMKHNVKLL